ncbi:MAG: Lrp/AsnC ligand binding domain-containing protein [Candidatus Omnitrophica bacterium]|nr:Lrp/AsnC ligand binding domain-containing protein [Candidatus Omnitrophota bacterium]
MSAKGMVLVKLAPGEEKQAIEGIRKVPGVNDVTGVFGAWDAVCHVEGVDLKTLASVVVERIRGLRGVVETETLIEVKL